MSLERTHCTKGHRLTEANTYFQKQWSNGNIVALCKACKRVRDKAKRERSAARRAEVHARNQAEARARGLPPGAPQHGTPNGATYYGCKCRPCLDAVNEAVRLRRLKKKAIAAGVPQRVILQLLEVPSKSSITTPVSFEDRLVGSTYDDPVLDAVLERLEA